MMTDEQKARIYCVKHGHANFYTHFFGYCYCGRCGEQIGDKLGSTFPGAAVMASPNCQDHPCEICDPIVKRLSKNDEIIWNRLKKGQTHRKKILKGIKW